MVKPPVETTPSILSPILNLSWVESVVLWLKLWSELELQSSFRNRYQGAD